MIRFAVSEIIRSLHSRRLSTSIATANVAVLVLLVCGLSLAAEGGREFLDKYRATMRIDAFLSPGADPMAVSAAVLGIPHAVSAEYLSEEKSLELFRSTRLPGLAIEIEDALSGAPLPALLRVRLGDDLDDPSRVAAAIREIPGVDDVFFGHVAAERIGRVAGIYVRAVRGIEIVAGLLGVLLAINSIRSAFLPRRDEIRVFALWGAPDRFIVVPSLLEGGVIGLAGAVFGATVLFLVYWWLEREAGWIAGYRPSLEHVSGMLLLSFLAGAAGGAISAYEGLLER